MLRTWYRGKLLNQRTINMLEAAEARLGHKVIITQGSYNPSRVKASAGTHDGGGVVDLVATDVNDTVLALRKVGFAAWYRSPSQGPWPAHIHAVAIGDPDLSPSARRQVSAYFNRRNGLANNGPDNGPRLQPIPVWPVAMLRVNAKRVEQQFRPGVKNPRSFNSVQRVQHALNKKLDGADLLEDGVAGPVTRAAYTRWEKLIDPENADGIPGPTNLRKLCKGLYEVV